MLGNEEKKLQILKRKYFIVRKSIVAKNRYQKVRDLQRIISPVKDQGMEYLPYIGIKFSARRQKETL